MKRITFKKESVKLKTKKRNLLLLIISLLVMTACQSAVTFKDPKIEEVVRKKIDKLSGTINKEDINWITELKIDVKDIDNLDGIEALNNLEDVTIKTDSIKDISALAGLENLKELNIDTYLTKESLETINQLKNNNVDVTYVIYFADSQFENLVYKYIKRNNDIKFDKLTNKISNKIKKIDIYSFDDDTRIKSLDGLQYFNNLESLSLTGLNITDISRLSSLRNLKELNLNSNQIKDITPLKNLNKLRKLSFASNEVKDISVLRNLNNIEEVGVGLNKGLKDISPVLKLARLKEVGLGILDTSEKTKEILKELKERKIKTAIYLNWRD